MEDLRREFGLGREEAKLFVDSFFEELINLVVEKGRLELRGFGVFKMKKFGGRFIKNPRTGVEIYVEERHSIGFKPSSTFNKHEKG
ncbi:MAG: HU family DNA-binding protein [Aquificaceae bacterium]|nr:HU family DNA-binding protein [Aquificaceae bacterium]MCX7989383.1 HU family DNA-binding protein [Aquificaceae bacterium]MDW8032373.1 HU family DNA-binding protein [Aquificaceae bacterium]MDW8293836.1 HU family DNA-binding protein [Aquificaceae bacterium]